MKITAKEKDVNDILLTFRLVLLPAPVHLQFETGKSLAEGPVFPCSKRIRVNCHEHGRRKGAGSQGKGGQGVKATLDIEACLVVRYKKEDSARRRIYFIVQSIAF